MRRVPAHLPHSTIQVEERDAELDGVTDTHWLYHLRVGLIRLSVNVDPRFSPEVFWFTVVLVLRPVGFSVIFEVETAADCLGLILRRDHLTLKNSVNPQALLPADRNRLAPGERPLEEQNFVVRRDKPIFNFVCKVIHRLTHLSSESFAECRQFDIIEAVQLDEGLYDRLWEVLEVNIKFLFQGLAGPTD